MSAKNKRKAHGGTYGKLTSQEETPVPEESGADGHVADAAEKTNVIDLDHLWDRIGGFGRFQWWQTNVLGYIWVAAGFITLQMVYNNHTHHNGSPYPGTIGDTFNLVGNRAWLLQLSSSMYFIGWLLGSLVLGYASDRWGRKSCIGAGILLAVLAGAMVAAAPSIEVYCAGRLIMGLAVGGAELGCWVLAAEFWPLKSRTIMGPMFQAYWGLGTAVIPIFWLPFQQNWRLFVVCSTIPIFLVFVVWKWIPESPRWLFVQGKEEKAFGVLQKVAKMNRKDYPDLHLIQEAGTEEGEIRFAVGAPLDPPSVPLHEGNHVQKSHSREEDEGSHSNPEDGIEENLVIWSDPNAVHMQPHRPGLWSLVRTGPMRLRMFVMITMWFVVGITYYGIVIYTGELSGDIFLNTLISGAIEIPAYAVAVIAIHVAGRKKGILIFFWGTALCAIAEAMVHTLHVTEANDLHLALAFGIKIFSSGAFSITYLYSIELLPTEVRSLGVGVASQFARIAGIISPVVTANQMVAMWVMGGCSVFAGIVVWWAPETKGQSFVDTVDGLH